MWEPQVQIEILQMFAECSRYQIDYPHYRGLSIINLSLYAKSQEAKRANQAWNRELRTCKGCGSTLRRGASGWTATSWCSINCKRKHFNEKYRERNKLRMRKKRERSTV